MIPPYGAGPPEYSYEGDYDQWGRPADPMNYDLGNYTAPPSGEFRGPPGPHPVSHGYPAPPGALPAEPGRYAHGEAIDYEDDEAPRSGRRWLIAAALAGSIGIGGGIAYTYKSYFVPRATDRPPVVKASKDAPKTLPDNPGGKRFANTDSKLMGRLEAEEGAAPQSATGQTDANGVRRVSTVAIGRDGALTPPEATAPPIRPTVSVPGLTIVDGFGGRGLPPPPPTVSGQAVDQALQLPSEPSGPAPAPQRSQVVAKAAPAPPPRPVSAESPTPPAARPAPPERQPDSKSVASVAATGPSSTDTAKSPINGYVAVLASHRSRIDALKKFADLQQKYDLLQGKIPDVLEADLSARGLGVMYRLVVGPPGSREAASAFCSQIKTAGHPDCWITGY
jgi:hypothetical protein